jgi:hypothetical protein
MKDVDFVKGKEFVKMGDRGLEFGDWNFEHFDQEKRAGKFVCHYYKVYFLGRDGDE